VLSIFAIGIVLGIAYNSIGLSSRPARGLPWVGGARSLEKVESLVISAGDSAGVPAPVVSTGADVAGERHSGADTDPGFDSGKSEALRSAARSDEPGARLPPATRVASGVKLTAAAIPTEAMAAPAPVATDIRAGLPVIPDLGRPLQVELPTVEKFVNAAGALIVDAREREAFAAGHIPGAVSIPFEDAAREPAVLEKLDARGRPVIVYCSGGSCESSRMLADLMVRDFAMRRVLVYEGGFAEWAKSGKPVETEPE
jgi:rhodanese-related sulfurtransferase